MIAHKETWAGLVAALLAHAAGVRLLNMQRTIFAFLTKKGSSIDLIY